MLEKIDKIQALLNVPNVDADTETAITNMKILNLLVDLRTEAEQLILSSVVFNEADKTKTQQKENIVAIMQADEKDGIYKSEVELSCKCPICGKEMTSQVVKHHHCKECKEHFTTT